MGGSLATFLRGTRKAWLAVSAVEFVTILILAAGLAHFATHADRDQDEPESGRDSGRLASLDQVNRTLQVATQRWESCQNQTRMLEADTSALSSEMAKLKERLRLQELEKKGLEDQLMILRNWTQELQYLNKLQKEIIGHFYRQHQERMSSHGSSIPLQTGLASLVLTVAVALWV